MEANFEEEEGEGWVMEVDGVQSMLVGEDLCVMLEVVGGEQVIIFVFDVRNNFCCNFRDDKKDNVGKDMDKSINNVNWVNLSIIGKMVNSFSPQPPSNV